MTTAAGGAPQARPADAVPVALRLVGQIALITVDNPPVNVITSEIRAALRGALIEVRRLVPAKARAVVLLCKGSTFFSGADIGEFSGPPKEQEYRQLFGELEQLPVPVVAAMHGTVMGGGVEVALACHYRVAAPGTRLGLPELNFGIFAGGGGTQRLPRLIGVEHTVELLLSAKPIDAARALELGAIDALIEGELTSGALHYAEMLLASGKGPLRTCDRAVDPATASPQILERLRADARRLYPNRASALQAVEVVASSARLSFEAGLSYETEQVNIAKRTIESHALVHLFFAEREARKVPDLPRDTRARSISKAAIVGSGTMGGGIAICFANAGIPVTVLDVSEQALERGLGTVARSYDAMVSRGRISPAERTARLAAISGTTDYAQLRDADLIVEAVYEDLALKRRIFSRLDEAAKPGAILATNTSTLDVGAIAEATRRPADVLGLHFFSPANVMPLLEVVRAPRTAPEVIQSSLEFARRIRKTAVVARVGYGFIGNRMLEGYGREAERLVLEGETPRRVDTVLENWGMAMGILAVFDLAGIDVGVNVHKANAERYPPDPSYYQADVALHAAGRVGQKSAAGYYRYEAGGRTRLDDPAAIAILRQTAQRLQIAPREHSDQEILERCLYPLINDGFRVLEEGVAIRPGDIDVVWTSGYGFPRYRGGPMFYADSIGLRQVYDAICRFRSEHGPMHWRPAALLERLALAEQTLANWECSRD